MQKTLKRKEIDIENINLKNKFMIKNYINLPNDNWFKGSRNRGIR